MSADLPPIDRLQTSQTKPPIASIYCPVNPQIFFESGFPVEIVSPNQTFTHKKPHIKSFKIFYRIFEIIKDISPLT